MPEYRYRAKDLKGHVYSGVMEADGIPAFYKTLREQGQFCISVEEKGNSPLDISLTRKSLRLRDLAVFCRQFGTMLNSGIPVIRCLDVLYQQTSKKRMKAVILSVYESVQRGESLSRAMKLRTDAFPELLLSMVEAGEASGTLDTVMERMADQYERENQMKNKVLQAVIYPAILLLLSVAVVIFLLTYILPTFSNMYGQFGGKLPAVTRFMLGIGQGFTKYWYLILIILLAVILGARMLLKNPGLRREWDKLKLRMPILGRILTILESARFARTLASLFSSGLPIIQSIEIVIRVMKNAFMKQQLAQANEDIRRGVSISASIRKRQIFPELLTSMINIGEESGDMDGILNKTAAFYDDEASAAIQRLIALIEPVMIVTLAVIVGFIIISVITPIFGLYSSISSSG